MACTHSLLFLAILGFSLIIGTNGRCRDLMPDWCRLQQENHKDFCHSRNKGVSIRFCKVTCGACGVDFRNKAAAAAFHAQKDAEIAEIKNQIRQNLIKPGFGYR